MPTHQTIAKSSAKWEWTGDSLHLLFFLFVGFPTFLGANKPKAALKKRIWEVLRKLNKNFFVKTTAQSSCFTIICNTLKVSSTSFISKPWDRRKLVENERRSKHSKNDTNVSDPLFCFHNIRKNGTNVSDPLFCFHNVGSQLGSKGVVPHVIFRVF